jgi:hypothetical protein
MNPHVSISWFEILFPFLMTMVIAGQFWWRRPIQTDRFYQVGSVLIVLALGGASIANLFYQRLLDVRAWPATSAFDQTVVTSVGIFRKLGDPIMGRTNRVQLYGCDGRLKAAFEPDNGGGLFKIAVDADNRLLIYSVRTDSIDTFTPDGRFLGRANVSSREMPFEFLKSGPSITKVGDCELIDDPVAGRPTVKLGSQVSPLEGGDWLLERVFTRINIFCVAFLGVILVATSFIRERRRSTT